MPGLLKLKKNFQIEKYACFHLDIVMRVIPKYGLKDLLTYNDTWSSRTVYQIGIAPVREKIQPR
ncbi:MAG: hypothetical protein ACD_75C00745G0002 [uncultured bacterium]|nr:MAG: hypothetical protein ACD_75C00745G0002 [uncultured bacterium]